MSQKHFWPTSRVWLLAACLWMVCSLVFANGTDTEPEWFKRGWAHANAGDMNQALGVWEQGLKGLPEKQSVFALQVFPNAGALQKALAQRERGWLTFGVREKTGRGTAFQFRMVILQVERSAHPPQQAGSRRSSLATDVLSAEPLAAKTTPSVPSTPHDLGQGRSVAALIRTVVTTPAERSMPQPMREQVLERYGQADLLAVGQLAQRIPSALPVTSAQPTPPMPLKPAATQASDGAVAPTKQRNGEGVAKPRQITLAMRSTPIAEVFDMLARSEKVNIVLGQGVATEISVSLHNVTIEEAIRAVAEAGGFVAELRGNTWLVLERKEFGKDNATAETRVVTHRLMHAPAQKVAEILTKHMSRYGKVTPLLERNMVVIEDRPEFLSKLQEVVRTLDVEPRQILLEAMILEIKLDKGESFGVNWNGIVAPGGSLSGSIGSRGSVSNQAAPSTDITTPLTLTGKTSPEFFAAVAGRRFTAYLSAMAQSGRVRTLSTPKLLALDGQAALTQIGRETGYSTTTTSNGISTANIQFLPSGVILRVTPTVDANNRIMLKLQPEVSTVSISALGVPDKATTQVTTQVVANNGETVFIGGLIARRLNSQKTGIPVLKDLPGLGGLFGSRAEDDSLTETVVLITPRLVSSSEPGAEGLPISQPIRALMEEARDITR